MARRYTIDEVKKVAENKGFKLLSLEYTKNCYNLLFFCNIHGEFSCTFHRLNKGSGCQKCSKIIAINKLKTSENKLKEIVQSLGLEFISEKDRIVTLKCTIHGILHKKLSYILGRGGCTKCGRIRCGDKLKTPIDILKTNALSQDLTLLSENYNKRSDLILLKCSLHGEFKTTVRSLADNRRVCLSCHYAKEADKRRTTMEEAYEITRNAGYEPLFTTFQTIQERVEVSCKKHGIFKGTIYCLKIGIGCPKCGIHRGINQGQVYNFVKDFYPDALENDRTMIKPFELDIYIPSLKLAIEYCGLFWHTEDRKGKNAHYEKMKLCNKNGIRLVTIYEDEWLERQEQVKGFIISILKKNTVHLFARKLYLKEVPKDEASKFLESTHIQGAPVFSIAFGLYNENELVGVITGNKHHRQGFNDIFVLNRLAFKTSISVAGGSSRLLKALLTHAIHNNYKKLISWSDNRWSEGNVYEKLGFKMTEQLPPDYSYVTNSTRVSKQSCQKKHLLKKGGVGKTEKEMATSLNLLRIYDCGKLRWEIDL